MFLHENKKLFGEVTDFVSKKFRLDKSVVIKDYYVTMLLRGISLSSPDLMFKGGTSLSKGYGIINRFSEDLDLTLIPSNPMSEAQRRHFNHNIENCFKQLGLKLSNDMIRYKSDFVCFKSKFPCINCASYITEEIKIESVLRRKGRVVNAPYQRVAITNYIYNALKDSSMKLLETYSLVPFYVNIYDIRYTLCEKLISVGNNYLRGKSERLSRHLYDIHKLLGVVPINEELRQIFIHVVECTQERGFDDAIINGNNLERAIYRALTEDFYKYDYINVSSQFIFDTVDYETAKNSVMRTVMLGLCDTSSKNGLRCFEVVSINKDIVTYKDLRTGKVYGGNKTFLKTSGVANNLTNYKLSKDGKLIKRF